MSTVASSTVDHAIPHLSVGPIWAEYSLARSQVTGDWVAVGTVHSLQPLATPPVWILVGIGDTASDAVEDLRRQLEQQAMRATLQNS